ncbi:MAG: hydratase [Variovorax sp.]|nr:MAG: hydratase [Variovorax sp.]
MPNPAAEAADLFWSAWQHGAALEALPPACRPQTRAEGYAVQALLAPRSAKPVAGWKIAATSTAGQKHINVSGPLAGRLLAERVRPDGATFSMAGNRMAVAEAEFVFRMARDLPPRAETYTQDEVMDAVADLHLGIEVPNSRFADFVGAGEAQLIADNACAHEFMLGPRVEAPWRDLDLAAHRVHATVAGPERSYERDGIGANVLGDPRIALTWLANELSQNGVTLQAGQFVTTGTCVVPLEIAAGDVVTADFGALGRATARFTD